MTVSGFLVGGGGGGFCLVKGSEQHSRNQMPGLCQTLAVRSLWNLALQDLVLISLFSSLSLVSASQAVGLGCVWGYEVCIDV